MPSAKTSAPQTSLRVAETEQSRLRNENRRRAVAGSAFNYRSTALGKPLQRETWAAV